MSLLLYCIDSNPCIWTLHPDFVSVTNTQNYWKIILIQSNLNSFPIFQILISETIPKEVINYLPIIQRSFILHMFFNLVKLNFSRSDGPLGYPIYEKTEIFVHNWRNILAKAKSALGWSHVFRAIPIF